MQILYLIFFLITVSGLLAQDNTGHGNYGGPLPWEESPEIKKPDPNRPPYRPFILKSRPIDDKGFRLGFSVERQLARDINSTLELGSITEVNTQWQSLYLIRQTSDLSELRLYAGRVEGDVEYEETNSYNLVMDEGLGFGFSHEHMMARIEHSLFHRSGIRFSWGYRYASMDGSGVDSTLGNVNLPFKVDVNINEWHLGFDYTAVYKSSTRWLMRYYVGPRYSDAYIQMDTAWELFRDEILRSDNILGLAFGVDFNYRPRGEGPIVNISSAVRLIDENSFRIGIDFSL